MHASTMFNRPQAPAVETYDLNMIAPQFAGWNFQTNTVVDQHTPQIALMTIQEIQQQALRGHPIRVGAFNILSENAFNNPTFQDLLFTIIARIVMGIQNGEWRNLEVAAGAVIARSVKCCASAMAASDPEFMASLPQGDAGAVRENADIWNYLVALAQGQAQYVPFAAMSTGSGLSGVSSSTQAAMQDARSLRGGNAGAFVESAPNYDGITAGRYNNDGGVASGRYGRRLEKMLGKVEGSMQQALMESGVSAPAPVDNGPYQSRIRRPNPVPTAAPNPEAAAAAAKFDSDITDFSKPVSNTPVQPKVEEKQPEVIFSAQMGDIQIDLIREHKENGMALWKPSRAQRFHPAWCKRTHRVRYFESTQGYIIAVLQALTQQEKEKVMDYDAHAIDPMKGQPEPDAPVRPVREEAKVLYNKAEDVKVKVVIAERFGSEEDVNGAIRAVRLSAEMSETVPDAYSKMSLINSPVIYPTAEAAAEDAIVIRAIQNSKDLAEAASYMSKISNDLARVTINDVMVRAINSAMNCELGVGINISDFAEDGPVIIKFLEDKEGALVAEKLRAHQTALLRNNVSIVPAEEMKAYADATLTTEDQEELSEEMLKRVLFLQRNVCAVWVNFTDNELAIGAPEKGAAMIQPDSLGALHQIAKTVFKDAIGSFSCSEQYLVTKDSARYRLHRGLLNREAYLLSKEVK